MTQSIIEDTTITIHIPTPYSSTIGRFAIDAPNSSAHWYDSDTRLFDMPKMRVRKCTIRASHYGEFEPPSPGVPLPPPLWVQVVRIGAWHYRLPFWCGPQPFAANPLSDETVVAIVSEKQSFGGYEPTALEKWRRDFYAYRQGRRA